MMKLTQPIKAFPYVIILLMWWLRKLSCIASGDAGGVGAALFSSFFLKKMIVNPCIPHVFESLFEIRGLLVTVFMLRHMSVMKHY